MINEKEYNTSMFNPTFIGICGAGIILLAFILNQTGAWKRESFSYDLANVLGSALLVVYAYFLKSYPFIVLNGVWLAVSLKDVIKPKKYLA